MTPRLQRALIVLAITIAGIAVDQAVKEIAFDGLRAGPVPVIDGLAQLRAIENRGAMLGMGSGLDAGPRRFIFTIAEGALLVVLAGYAAFAKTARSAEAAALSFVVAGGASNVLDRIVLGFVRDYAMIGRPGWPTAAFNLADVFVVIGAVLLLVTAWRAARAPARAAAALLVVASSIAPALATEAARPFPVRIVKTVGALDDPKTEAHVAFCRSVGFNALWAYSHQAGRWDVSAKIDPAFVRFAKQAHASGMDVWVSVNPIADTRDTIVFSEREGERRILAYFRKLHAKAGVDHVVISFDDQPVELHQFRDIVRYGFGAAPAHLDLVARVARQLPKGMTLFMCAAAYSDAHLGDGRGPYARAFLSGLAKLPPSVGIVWTGTTVRSPSITRADLEATRARLGGRRLFLYDNFPVNDDDTGDALGLVLGALRRRDPAIRDAVDAYLACPMNELGASRFPLSMIAEFLMDPEGYDPDRAVRSALDRFSGGDKEVRTALDTQILEWGGWIDSRNYWPRDILNAFDAGKRLDDPAFVESFTWTADRYPGRMRALGGLPDRAFRDDLLLVMRRRLTIARVMPLAVEYLARIQAGRPDAAEVLARIEDERRTVENDADAKGVLDVFLRAAAIPIRNP